MTERLIETLAKSGRKYLYRSIDESSMIRALCIGYVRQVVPSEYGAEKIKSLPETYQNAIMVERMIELLKPLDARSDVCEAASYLSIEMSMAIAMSNGRKGVAADLLNFYIADLYVLSCWIIDFSK